MFNSKNCRKNPLMNCPNKPSNESTNKFSNELSRNCSINLSKQSSTNHLKHQTEIAKKKTPKTSWKKPRQKIRKNPHETLCNKFPKRYSQKLPISYHWWWIFLAYLKVSKYQNQFFLKLYCPKNKQNIRQDSALSKLGQKFVKYFIRFWGNGFSRKIASEI